MTLLAGVFARDPRRPIQDSTCESIRRTLSRSPEDRVESFRTDQVFLAKVDIGAYGQPAFHASPSGSVSLLVGEPLLELNDNARRTRKEDLDLLHRDWEAGRLELLRKARGMFCAVHYDATRAQITLIADKLGVRPLYYWLGEHYVIFATALRVLEAMSEVPKSMDFQAVTEIAHLRYALSSRTPYAGIALLKGGEIVAASATGVSHSSYWRWDEVPQSRRSESELVAEGYRRFRSAVQRRIRNDTSTLSTLSGGLDSRSVVSMLRDLNVAVHTFNFGWPETQDRVFGREFARLVGTIHEEITLRSDRADMNGVSQEFVHAWAASPGRAVSAPERPGLEWGGNGGSVGLGLLYMSRHLVDLLRAGDREAVIDYWLKDGRVLRKLMQPVIYELAVEVLRRGISEELDDLHCEDPARSYYLFLMLNDQRRQLHDYFENLDLHRLDLHMPFWDSDFLELLVQAPIEMCLDHHYYMKWLKLFPPRVTSVPWTVYPGHEPCPVPFDVSLRGQWDGGGGGQNSKAARRRLLAEASNMLRAHSFPRPLIRRGFLRLAALTCRLGVGDYGYVIQAAEPYCRYWASSGGTYALPQGWADVKSLS